MQQFLIDSRIGSSFKIDDISSVVNIINDKQTLPDTAIIMFKNVYKNIDEEERDELCDIVFSKCEEKDYFFQHLLVKQLSLRCLRELFRRRVCLKEFFRRRVNLDECIIRSLDHFLSITNKKLLVKYVDTYHIYDSRIHKYGMHLLMILSHAYEFDDITTAEIIVSDPTFCKKISVLSLVGESCKKFLELKKFFYYVCKNNHIDFLHVLFKNPRFLSNYQKRDQDYISKISIGDTLEITDHPTYFATLNGNIDLLQLFFVDYANESSGYIALLNICTLLQQKNSLSSKDEGILIALLYRGITCDKFGKLIHHIYETYEEVCIEKYFTIDLLKSAQYEIIVEIANHKKSNLYNQIVIDNVYTINLLGYVVFKSMKNIDAVNDFTACDSFGSSDSLSDDEDSFIDDIRFEPATNTNKLWQEANSILFKNQIPIEDIIKYYVVINNVKMLQLIRRKYKINYSALYYSVVKFAHILAKRDPLLYFMCHLDVNPHCNKIVTIICGNNNEGLLSTMPKDMIKIIIGHLLDELWMTIWHS
uniref:Uncharacterized protein n=1 Tax=viral metagenome TaxID=1070528 RepID=A0A6C0C9K4_9ZZZZ